MNPPIKTRVSALVSFSLFFTSLLPLAFGQTPVPNSPTPQQEDVLRISTDLVQTDLIVLGKDGPVKGLTKDQFELLVDGQPQSVAFFESVETGGSKEAAQIAAARGQTGTGTPSNAQPPATFLRPTTGRSFILFVDDLHLAPEGVSRTRDLLQNFVKAMGEDDQALIISPSGQIGFLQQLTDNKTALKLAVSRINYQAQSVPSSGRRAMTVYEARAIDMGQRDVLDYKVNEYMDDMGLIRRRTFAGTNMDNRRMTGEMAVKQEARNILHHANTVGEAVLGALEFVARGSGSLPGRKLLFFISDGFVLDTRSSQTTVRLNRVIDTASRTGVSIYTVDSKGLDIGNVTAGADVFSNIANEGGRLNASTDSTSLSMANASATKEILRTLAADTGGRAILNRNDLESGINQILKETESYYVLAWKPQIVESGKPKFSTLKVSIKGRPDLKVLSRKGFYSAALPASPAENKTAAKDSKTPAAKVSETELRAAISSAFPRRQMSVSAYTTYSNESADTYKIITFADLSNYQNSPGGSDKAEVDFAVVVLNDQGKSVTSVAQKVNISASGSQPFRVVATLPNMLPAGVYQVRTAAREAQTGRIGSAFQWLEIPKLKPGELTVSNLLVAEVTGKPGEAPALDIESRFARTSVMLIQMFTYNAARSANNAPPDVAITLQVLQNGKQVIASPPQPISTSGVTDLSRLQYGAEIPLASFSPGRYTLKVTANDRMAKTTASQHINFTIE